MILLFTCLVTPARLAFAEEDTLTWEIINQFQNVMFLIDMVIIFLSAYYDDNMRIVTNRKIIAIQYLKGWFLIDLLAIFPTDVFLQGSNDIGDGSSV